MALEPQPPPSPMGKPTLPPKHVCSQSSPCAIRLSEVGKRFHAFPKGSFKARFAPPAVPRSVLQYLAKSPPTWTWTTRAGPRAGKSFHVPTVPTACSGDSPRAVQWVVSIFHAFKAQLAPQAIDLETGRVLPSYVKLYQNNMLVHLRSQQAQLRARVKPSPTPAIPPQTGHPTTPKSAPGPTIADLLLQIEKLRSDFEALKRQLEEPSSEAPSSPSLSPQATATVLPNNPPSPPSSTSSMSIAEESIAHPDHTWLQPVIDHKHAPPFIRRIDSSMVPIFSHAMPDDVQQTVVIGYPKVSPRYVGVDSNGDLRISAQCPSEIVVMFINLTENDIQPPPVPSIFRI